MVSTARLVGRARDVAQVVSGLTGTGLCTIVGPGGVGKSSVAREVARAFFGRPVIWIDAEPVDHLDGLLDQLVRQSGLDRLPGESSADVLSAGLDGSPALIVLDGVEHLGDELVPIAFSWPTSPAGPWLLATSRRPLGALLPVVRLEPLATVAGLDETRSPAAVMLIEAIVARGVDEGALVAESELFAQVVVATGGLPVAINLTADHVARFGVRFAAEQPVPIDQIVDRCIGRTLSLLSDDERAVFERLGLTAGAFTLDLIDAVQDHPDRATAQAIAGRLVEHGLVFATDGRFDMLPPIRDGAVALLTRGGTLQAALTGLIDHVLEWSEAADSIGESTLVANLETCLHLAWLAVDHPELRTRAADLVHALFGPMYDRVRQTELLRLLEAVSRDSSLDPRRDAETARCAAICASECNTIAHARSWLDRAHAAASQLDDTLLQNRVWSIDAWLALDTGDHTKAIAAAERSMAAAAPDDRNGLTLQSMRCIAEASYAMGDLDRAEEVATEVVRLAAQTHPFDALVARTTLGWCLVERGRRAEAVAHARRLAEDIYRQQTEPSEIAVEAELIAIAADPRTQPVAPSFDNDHRFTWWMRLQQQIRLAARLPIDEHWEHVMHTAADVIVLADLVPLGYPRICATNLLGDAALAGGELRDAARAYEQALRDAARGSYRLRGADAFDGAAAVAARVGDHEIARSAAAAAACIREQCGAAPWIRPSLPATVLSSRAAPAGWLRDGVPTPMAIDTIAQALRQSKHPNPLSNLTRAELQIARLVRRGMSNNEIASELVISRRTVESHLGRIFSKLDIRTRTQLATISLDHET